MSKPCVGLECLLLQFGQPGRAQCGVALLILLNNMIVSVQNLGMIFLAYPPKHHCKVPTTLSLNETIPFVTKSGHLEPSECLVYTDPRNHSLGTKPCTSWAYEYKRDEWTVAGEWDLVCDRKYMVSLTTTIYFAGALVGSILSGPLSDNIGRKPVYLGAIFLHIFIGVVQYFATSFFAFAVGRFVHGILVQSIMGALWCMVIELFTQDYRTEAALATSIFFTSGQFALIVAAYFFRNWRNMYLAITVPSIFVVAYIKFVPESFRWLVMKKRLSEAVHVAKVYARINKIELPPTFEKEVVKASGSGNDGERMNTPPSVANKGYKDLFRTPVLRRCSLIISYLWLASSLLFYGLSFYVPYLAGNRYANFAVSTTIEFGSRLLMYFSIKTIGRRITNSICFGITAFSTIGAMIIKTLGISDVTLDTVATVFIILGKAAASSTLMIVILQTQEIYPTVIRSRGFGFGAFFNRLGSMLSPQIIMLDAYFAPHVPLVVLGIVAVLATAAPLFLPETRWSPITDTIEQVEKMHSFSNSKQKRKKSTGINVSSQAVLQNATEIEMESLDPEKNHNGFDDSLASDVPRRKLSLIMPAMDTPSPTETPGCFSYTVNALTGNADNAEEYVNVPLGENDDPVAAAERRSSSILPHGGSYELRHTPDETAVIVPNSPMRYRTVSSPNIFAVPNSNVTKDQ